MGERATMSALQEHYHIPRKHSANAPRVTNITIESYNATLYFDEPLQFRTSQVFDFEVSGFFVSFFD